MLCSWGNTMRSLEKKEGKMMNFHVTMHTNEKLRGWKNEMLEFSPGHIGNRSPIPVPYKIFLVGSDLRILEMNTQYLIG